MGICSLAFSIAVLAIGRYRMGLGNEALRTLAFITLVFGGQATLYAIRERRHLWSSRPSLWVVVSSFADLLIASTLATLGLLMMPLPLVVVVGTLAAAVAFGVVLAAVKIPVFRRLQIA
jgi:H+-transporting ATPase